MLLGLLCDSEGPHEVRGLAHEMGVSKPVITRATSKLVAMGFALRWPSPNDKRVIRIDATEAGRAMRKALRNG